MGDLTAFQCFIVIIGSLFLCKTYMNGTQLFTQWFEKKSVQNKFIFINISTIAGLIMFNPSVMMKVVNELWGLLIELKLLNFMAYLGVFYLVIMVISMIVILPAAIINAIYFFIIKRDVGGE